VIEQKHTRSINRTTLSKKYLLSALDDPDSNIYQVASGLIRLIRKRIKEKSFHPNAAQRVLSITEKVFAVLRTSRDNSECILAVTNVSNARQELAIDLKQCEIEFDNCIDILTNKTFTAKEGKLRLILAPYDIVWLKGNV